MHSCTNFAISWLTLLDFRRAKRKAQQKAMEGGSSDREDGGHDTNARPPETEAHIQTDSDIEAKIATVSDQKEAKRLKRWVARPCTAPADEEQYSGASAPQSLLDSQSPLKA